MIWLTHIVFAFLIAKFFFVEFNVVQALLLFFSALFPDIDNKNSLLGKMFKLPVKHRTIFHSLILILPVAYLIFIFAGAVYFKIFLIGSLSHLFLDCFNVSGVKLFYPLRFRIKGPIRTGSFFDYLLLFVFLAFLILI